MIRCERRKELQRLEKPTSLPCGDRRPRPRDGLDLPVSYDRARAEQDLAGCPDLEAEPLAPAYKVSVEKDTVMDSVCLCKAVQASTRSSGHRPENIHLFDARAGLPECCVFLTADFSQLYNVVTKSAIFIDFPPFSFFYLFLYFNAFVLLKANFQAWPSDNHLQRLHASLLPFLRRKDLFGLIYLNMIF